MKQAIPEKSSVLLLDIQRQQLRVVVRFKQQALALFVIVPLVFWLLHHEVPSLSLWLWCISFSVLLWFRYQLIPSQTKDMSDVKVAKLNAALWKITSLICIICSVAAALVLPELNVEKQFLLLLIVLSLGVAVVSMVLKKRYFWMVQASWLPIAISLILQNNLTLMVGFTLFLGLLFLLRYTVKAQQTLTLQYATKEHEHVAFIAQLQSQIQQQEVLEDKLRDSHKEAEDANHAKSDFLAVVSHEMRTPVHGLLGMLDLLHGVRMNKEAREDLKNARRAARSLHKLVNDILDLSKMETGHIKLKNEPFHLEECVHDAVVPCMLIAEQQNTQVMVCFEQVPSVIYADQGKIKQALMNLVSNAVKFTTQGKVLLHIKTQTPPSTEKRKQRLHFSVQDTGIGIAEDDLKHVFEPFVQFDDLMERQYDGTGLGAGIAKALVEQMGGSLQVRSKLSQGTTFSFEIESWMEGALVQRSVTMTDQKEASLTHIVQHPLAEQTEQSPPSRQQKPTTTYHILVAEDDAISRRIALKRLQRVGFVVTLAKDGKEAWALLQQQKFDLILSDLRMPHMDGMTLTTCVRQQENINQHTYIIGLSAHATSAVKQQCLDVGMDDFLMKPIEPDKIIQKMQEILD